MMTITTKIPTQDDARKCYICRCPINTSGKMHDLTLRDHEKPVAFTAVFCSMCFADFVSTVNSYNRKVYNWGGGAVSLPE